MHTCIYKTSSATQGQALQGALRQGIQQRRLVRGGVGELRCAEDYVYIYIHIYTYIYIYILHVYVYTYIYIYIYTCIHTFIYIMCIYIKGGKIR